MRIKPGLHLTDKFYTYFKLIYSCGRGKTSSSIAGLIVISSVFICRLWDCEICEIVMHIKWQI